MSLFLDEKTKEAKSKDYLLATIGNKDLTTPAQNTMTDYLAGWNECEKHVRESVSEGFDEFFSGYVDECSLHHEFDAHEFWQAAKLSSLVEIEQLKAQTKELVESLRFYANGDAFSPDYDSLREEGDSDQCNPDSDCLFKGKLARATLKELGELG